MRSIIISAALAVFVAAAAATPQPNTPAVDFGSASLGRARVAVSPNSAALNASGKLVYSGPYYPTITTLSPYLLSGAPPINYYGQPFQVTNSGSSPLLVSASGHDATLGGYYQPILAIVGVDGKLYAASAGTVTCSAGPASVSATVPAGMSFYVAGWDALSGSLVPVALQSITVYALNNSGAGVSTSTSAAGPYDAAALGAQACPTPNGSGGGVD